MLWTQAPQASHLAVPCPSSPHPGPCLPASPQHSPHCCLAWGPWISLPWGGLGIQCGQTRVNGCSWDSNPGFCTPGSDKLLVPRFPYLLHRDGESLLSWALRMRSVQVK